MKTRSLSFGFVSIQIYQIVNESMEQALKLILFDMLMRLFDESKSCNDYYEEVEPALLVTQILLRQFYWFLSVG